LNLVIPNIVEGKKVTVIGADMFYYNNPNYLKSIVLPSGLTTIETEAFKCCSNLQSLIIPNGVTTIGAEAFYDCESLSSLSLPNTITDIDEEAFKYCVKLPSKLILPQNIKSIAENAFYQTNIQDVTLPAGELNIDDKAFGKRDNDFTIAGYTHGYSQEYAIRNNFKFRSIGTDNTQSVTLKYYTEWDDEDTLFAVKHSNYNELIASPGIPTKSGYVFKGWIENHFYLSGDYPTWDIAKDLVTGDTTFIAQWTAVTPPASATNVKSASSSYSSANTTWNKVSGVNGYDVARSTSSNGVYATIARVTGTSYNNGGLTTGKVYYYKVRSFKTVVGTRVYSTNWSNIASVKPVPSTVVNVKSASSSYCTANTTWNKVTGASGYEIFRATSSKGTYNIVARVTSLNFNNGGLIAGRTYYYKVRAYKTVGSARVYSNNWSNIASSKPVPSTVTKVKAARASSKSIKITWVRVTGASGYEIFRSTSTNGKYTIVARTSNSSFVNGGLTKGHTYYYKVRAYRTVGNTRVYCNYWSNVASAKTY